MAAESDPGVQTVLNVDRSTVIKLNRHVATITARLNQRLTEVTGQTRHAMDHRQIQRPTHHTQLRADPTRAGACSLRMPAP